MRLLLLGRLGLAEKLVEEAKEFLEDRNKEKLAKEELADVLEVIEAIYIAFQYTKEEVRKIQNEKRAKKGAFEQRYILEKMVVPAYAEKEDR